MAITGYLNFPKQNQIPDNAILDISGKQAYLGNAYLLSTPELNLPSTAEKPLVLIFNPATSNKTIFINLRRVTSDLQAADIRYYINPTITTNGTIATPLNLRPASPNTSVTSCYTLPTISANGTLYNTLGAPTNYYVVSDSTLMMILDPGKSMLLTGLALAANTNINSDISWFEL